MKVGTIEVESVLDGWILSRLPSSKPLPEPGTPPWEDQHGMFRPDGMIESTVGAFVVRAGERVLLVDAGAGQAFTDGFSGPVVDVDDPDDPMVSAMRAQGLDDATAVQVASEFGRTRLEQGGLPAGLQAIGVAPEDVTDVVLTHLHYDHIGWASAGGAAFFPNATIRCAAADAEYFLAGPPEEVFMSLVFHALPAGERLGPVLDRLETWDSDGTIAPGVDVRLAPGHTPGSSVVVLSDGTARAMLLGDMIHCPLELMDPDFDLLVDHDQQLANDVREAYARELEGSDIVAAGSHFPGLQFGRLLASEAERRWTFDV
jgi:glyoxylase-like metal-dependent hydrolase (beta-lactamase superfamily II)